MPSGPLTGPPALSWRLALAVLALTILIVAGASLAGLAGGLMYERYAGLATAGARAAGEIEALGAKHLAVYLAGFQIATVLLTLAAAHLLRRSGMRFFPVVWPRRGLFILPLSVVALLIMASLGGALVYQFDKPAFETDMKPFAALAHTDAMWVLLATAAVGAPIAEELLFRGFLFSVLRASPLGFAGAALVSAVFWSSLHANYSLYGMALVLMIGVYLAWLRERTESLVPSLVCHAAYNGLIVLALAMTPETALG
jgi:membrane protease YdiL (CAAX protease family)